MQELCVVSDASTKPNDVDSGDENDGETRDVVSTTGGIGDGESNTAVAGLVGAIDPD